MFKNQNRTVNANRAPIDTLIIAGNGFGTWLGLPTQYSDFLLYSLTHRGVILKSFESKKSIITPPGKDSAISDVELIYGNSFSSGELSYEQFWSTIESCLTI